MRTLPCAVVVVATFIHGVARADPAPVQHDDPVDTCAGAFEAAQIEHKAAALVRARARYVQCELPSCPAELRQECTRRHDEVERAIPTVVFAVRDANAYELGAKIDVDGVPFPARPGRADPIDPGPHVVRVTIGERSTETTVTFRVGEKNRLVVIPWSGSPAVVAPVPEQTATPKVLAGRKRSVGPYVLGGIGLVAAVTAVGALVIADNEESEPRPDAARTANTVAFASGFGSLLLLGGAFVWYLMDLPPKSGL